MEEKLCCTDLCGLKGSSLLGFTPDYTDHYTRVWSGVVCCTCDHTRLWCSIAQPCTATTKWQHRQDFQPEPEKSTTNALWSPFSHLFFSCMTGQTKVMWGHVKVFLLQQHRDQYQKRIQSSSTSPVNVRFWCQLLRIKDQRILPRLYTAFNNQEVIHCTNNRCQCVHQQQPQ